MTHGKFSRKHPARLGKSIRLSVASVAACFIAAPVLSNPLNPVVVNGAASFNQAGNVLTVTNGNGAIINWDKFSIKAGETTRFLQTSASSSVLNRVLSSDPSLIYGTLSSNGRVWLVNPAGIMVGPGGRVDTAGFVASTLNISNENFLAGRNLFINDSSAGNVINQGEIRTPAGGSVYLIGSNVSNEGIITTPKGETILAAGVTVSLIDSALPGVKVDITGAEGNVTNLGTVIAEAGRIGMAGVLVKNSGILNASSVVNEGGRIFLRASKDAYVDGSGRIVATGTKGGSVEVLGNRVAVMDNASIDVSGTGNANADGGSIKVGGDYQGKNPDIRNASITWFGPNASLKADAGTVGAGGTVIVWADDTTRAYGNISARGGVLGGNGGFVETSGRRYLDVAGIKVRADAQNGTAGMWLLDPYSLNITASSTNFTPAGGSPYTFSSGSGATNVLNTDIKAQLDGGTSVTLQTSGTSGDGFGNGDINVSAPIAKTAGVAATLLLKAHNDIVVGTGIGISSTSGALNVVLNSDSDGVGGGAIKMNSGSFITSNGGNVTLGGGMAGDGTGNAVGTSYVNGITLDGASINAGGGNTSLRGTGVAGTGSWRYGVFLENGATVTSTGTGAITLDGTGGANMFGGYGVMLETGSQISTVDGAIAITGHGTGTTLENVGVGVQLGAKVISTGAGAITLNGTGGAGTDINRGVYIDGAGTKLESVDGNISITGFGAGTGIDNRGVYISGGATVKATGAGAVTLDGTGSAAGTNYNYGVYIKNLGTEVSTASGAVSITGHGAGSGTDNYGVWVTDYAKVASAGPGAITLNGFGGASTGSYNTGTYVSSSAVISAIGTGAIMLNGTGGSSGTAGLSNRGVRVSSGASISTISGNIGITGTGAYDGDGVQVVGGAHVQSSTGAITLLGTAVDGSSSDAAYVSEAGTLVTTGGNIAITGNNLNTVGSGNRGVGITSSAHVVATGAGTIIVIGKGGHEGDGLHVHGGALVQSGTGLISLSGTSGDGIGPNWDWGVEVGDAGTLVTSGGGMTITGVSTSTDGTYSNYGLYVRTGAQLTTTAGLMTLNGSKGAGITSDAVRLSGTPAGGVVNAGAGLTVNGTGDVVVDVGSLITAAGSMSLNSTGNMTLGGGISANGIALTANGATSDIFVNSSVTSANGMTVVAGRDLWVGPGGGKLIATAGNQTINAGRDMSVIQQGGSAYVESWAGLQTINVGRNLLVEVDNTSGLEAHIEGGAGQVINAGGNLTLNAFDSDQTRINANGGDQSITVGGDMTLNAVADVAHVKSYAGAQTVNVAGTLSLLGSHSAMYGSSGQAINAGRVYGTGGRISSGYNIAGIVSGDITLDNGAYFSAANDVDLTFKGSQSTLALSNASYIFAGAPLTIHLDFTSRSSGGVMIDGLETIQSVVGGSGLFVSSLNTPATPGAGLDLAYAPVPVTAAIDPCATSQTLCKAMEPDKTPTDDKLPTPDDTAKADPTQLLADLSKTTGGTEGTFGGEEQKPLTENNKDEGHTIGSAGKDHKKDVRPTHRKVGYCS